MAPTRIAPRTRGDRAAIEAAADILARAERPGDHAGDAVAQSHADKELVELAELLGAPVYAEFVPNTASYPTSHPLFRGQVTRLAPATRKVLERLRRAVLGRRRSVHAVAAVRRRSDAAGHYAHPSRRRSVEIGKNYPPEVAILGDPRPRCRSSPLHSASACRRRKGVARDRLKDRSEAIAKSVTRCARRHARSRRRPVQALALLEASGAMLPKDAVVIEGRCECARNPPADQQRDPQSYSDCAAAASAGACPPTIVPSSRCGAASGVGIIGDGSALYTTQALWTRAATTSARSS